MDARRLGEELIRLADAAFGKRFVAPLNSGTQIRKAIKDFTRATQMQLTVAA